MKDDMGEHVKAGDTISFSYGIPRNYVVAKVARRKGKLVVLTPSHMPAWCPLSKLRKHVDGWMKWKE